MTIEAKAIYSKIAIARSADDALEWLLKNGSGYPRSHEQERADDRRRGYVMYDDPDGPIPAIYGYESLEKAGLADRVGLVVRQGVERVHFTKRQSESS